ncbi:ABC transporter ATP-binding protein [Paenibacillus donghaensis]|uniref:ABC transporter domain-containing protein n=1 Tax=Paenibacillus donghaensis TaxID=414771 RepID=A0A2Z2KRH0_9BACL|nr:ABC transporter ATP-binding protein [Paenibacillus donghaensis]ASA23021.1 hypothetical protein B9T62_20750 [Paenibacillus donghaensis]
MSTTIFEANGLCKKYGSAHALQDIHMTIRQGEIYGFIGENGAGKTTLMRIIGGLVHPSSGQFSLFGQSGARQVNQARRRVGFLIEMPSLYSHLDAEENLGFYCRMYGIKQRSRIGEVLQAVSLSDTGRKRVSGYSLGMRQRLGLAIALLNRPEFLVLDEPINGLDPTGIMEVRQILEQLAQEQGVAILISSHILSELQLLASRFGFIHRGRFIQEISASELMASAKSKICIQTGSKDTVLQILREQLSLADIAVTESGEITLPSDSIDMEQLMSVLLEHRVRLEGVHLSAPNLEHYYMKLIGGGK